MSALPFFRRASRRVVEKARFQWPVVEKARFQWSVVERASFTVPRRAFLTTDAAEDGAPANDP